MTQPRSRAAATRARATRTQAPARLLRPARAPPRHQVRATPRPHAPRASRARARSRSLRVRPTSSSAPRIPAGKLTHFPAVLRRSLCASAPFANAQPACVPACSVGTGPEVGGGFTSQSAQQQRPVRRAPAARFQTINLGAVVVPASKGAAPPVQVRPWPSQLAPGETLSMCLLIHARSPRTTRFRPSSGMTICPSASHRPACTRRAPCRRARTAELQAVSRSRRVGSGRARAWECRRPDG